MTIITYRKSLRDYISLPWLWSRWPCRTHRFHRCKWHCNPVNDSILQTHRRSTHLPKKIQNKREKKGVKNSFLFHFLKWLTQAKPQTVGMHEKKEKENNYIRWCCRGEERCWRRARRWWWGCFFVPGWEASGPFDLQGLIPNWRRHPWRFAVFQLERERGERERKRRSSAKKKKKRRVRCGGGVGQPFWRRNRHFVGVCFFTVFGTSGVRLRDAFVMRVRIHKHLTFLLF